MELNELIDDDNNVILIAHFLEYLIGPIDWVRPMPTRNENYFETTILNYSEDQFRRHFRTSRQTFDQLYDILKIHFGARGPHVPIKKQLLLSIHLLSSQDSFFSAGDKFGVSDSTAYYIFKHVISKLSALVEAYITWPAIEEYDEIANVFRNRSRGIPGVVGMIDGCHIPIKQPIGNAHDYYNRHQRHSIILQGICDHTLKFIDIFVGMPGRMHDARVFRQSPIANRLENILGDDRYHLLGDSAYPLSTSLLTPYRDNGHLNNRETIYNIKLSSIRSTIERSFGILKNKFRRLKFLDVGNIEFANEIIAACCVIHNFIILQNDMNEDDEPQDAIVVIENEIDHIHIGAGHALGQRKRQLITNML